MAILSPLCGISEPLHVNDYLFANPRVARAFVDYMATQGIILTIQQHTQSDIWLADESQAGRVRAELARFLENPADPRYLAAQLAVRTDQ